MDQEKRVFDRLWELTKELSVKARHRAEKHWKINTLRVEIASFRHRMSVKYRELGRFVYESIKAGAGDEVDYKESMERFVEDLRDLESEISDRERKIGELEAYYRELAEMEAEERRTPEGADTDVFGDDDVPLPATPHEVKEESGDVSGDDETRDEEDEAAEPEQEPKADKDETEEKKD